MADADGVSYDPVIRGTGREELDRDWLAASAECGWRAREALTRATEVLTGELPGRRPDSDLAAAWAAVGQGWAALCHAEAARGTAAAGILPGHPDVTT